MQKEEHSAAHEPLKLSLPVAIVFGALIIAVAILISQHPVEQKAAVPTNAGAAAGQVAINIRPVSADDHIVGSPNAKVVLVEYSDFECPYCSMIYPTLKKVVAESNGQVAWVYRNLPLDAIHPEARPAAEAAECVAAELGNDAYWKFTDALFANQKSIGTAFYHATAVSLGANAAQFDACVAAKTYDQRISTDASEANANGGNGTPYTIAIGKKGTPVPFSGAIPEAQMQTIIKTVMAQQGGFF